jgi:Fusaric acid resistance protein family
MTLVQSVRRPVIIAGFPLSTWAFALRIWAAMMVALYAAFWLQLESASSAAVTVAILARPTRGQAYQKAVYRVLATIIGVVASFVIAGLFPQSRSLFLIGFAGWLGLCVYVGGLLDGNRAYSGILSGYTVALVAVTQIDSPQNIFSAGINRGAAIVVGIAALALISELFAAPNIHTGLSDRLIAAHRRVRGLALAILRGESANPIQSARLVCCARSPRFIPTSRRSSPSRVAGGREPRQPGARPWHWSPMSAPRAHWHRSQPTPWHLSATRLARPSPMPSRRRAVRCSFACSSTPMLATSTRTTRFSPVMPWTYSSRTGGRRTPSKTCRRAAAPNAASMHPSTARVGRLREMACARFWRC